MFFPVGLITKEIGFKFIFRGHVYTSPPVWIGWGKVEKKGLVAFFGNKIFGLIGHINRIPLFSFHVGLELKDFLGRDMKLTNMSGAIPGLGQSTGKG